MLVSSHSLNEDQIRYHISRAYCRRSNKHDLFGDLYKLTGIFPLFLKSYLTSIHSALQRRLPYFVVSSCLYSQVYTPLHTYLLSPCLQSLSSKLQTRHLLSPSLHQHKIPMKPGRKTGKSGRMCIPARLRSPQQRDKNLLTLPDMLTIPSMVTTASVNVSQGVSRRLLAPNRYLLL